MPVLPEPCSAERDLHLGLYLDTMQAQKASCESLQLCRSDSYRTLEQLDGFRYAALLHASTEGVKAEALARYGALSNMLPEVISEVDALTSIVGHLTGEPKYLERNEIDKVLVSMKER